MTPKPLDIYAWGSPDPDVYDYDQLAEQERRDAHAFDHIGAQLAQAMGDGPGQHVAHGLNAASVVEQAVIEVLDYDESQHPRDDHGRWSSGDGGDSSTPAEPARPDFPEGHVAPVRYLMDGKATYDHEHGLAAPAEKDWQAITADPVRGARIADDYAALPADDPAAHDEYQALATEVHQQYEFLTGELGVHVIVQATDPYKNVSELRADLADNHTIRVLSTATTGGHPFFTDQQNDEFRAVHDAFGHAAIGRGFDRNGEEAAFQSHAQMFSPEAMQALATETRGQNSSLVYGPDHTFPPQKVALLPANDTQLTIRRADGTVLAASEPTADDDNDYAYTQCHHTSLGRSLHRRTTVHLAADDAVRAVLEYVEDQHPRDDHGRWSSDGGGEKVIPTTRSADGLVDKVKAEGGVTVKPATGEGPRDGYMVAFPGSTIVNDDKFFADHNGARVIRQFIRDHVDFFDKQGWLGLWHDQPHHEVAIDRVENYHGTLDDAKQLGSARDQQEIWDVVGQRSIPTGGSGGRDTIAASSAPPGLAAADHGGAAPEEGVGDDRRRAGGVGLRRGRLHAPGVEAESALRAVLDYSEDQHPRGPDGKWISDGGGDKAKPKAEVAPHDPHAPLVLTRDPHDDPNAKPDPAVAAKALATAKGWNPELYGQDPYQSGHEFNLIPGYKEGEPYGGAPDKWEPGTAWAQSEAATQWQSTFQTSKNIAMAADELRGYPAPDGAKLDYNEKSFADARELLNAMANGPAEGAGSQFTIEDNKGYLDENNIRRYNDQGMRLETFGQGELNRGIADNNGELLATFKQAQAEDRPVSWAIAGFTNPEAGNVFGSGGDAHSAEAVALDYALPPEKAQGGAGSLDVKSDSSPILVTLNSGAQGLTIDGKYEVVTGGEFKVTDIKQERIFTGITDETGAPAWKKDAEDLMQSVPVTRVYLTQTATPTAVG